MLKSLHEHPHVNDVISKHRSLLCQPPSCASRTAGPYLLCRRCSWAVCQRSVLVRFREEDAEATSCEPARAPAYSLRPCGLRTQSHQPCFCGKWGTTPDGLQAKALLVSTRDGPDSTLHLTFQREGRILLPLARFLLRPWSAVPPVFTPSPLQMSSAKQGCVAWGGASEIWISAPQRSHASLPRSHYAQVHMSLEPSNLC